MWEYEARLEATEAKLHIYVYTHTHTHTCIHAYTHTRTHTHTHTQYEARLEATEAKLQQEKEEEVRRITQALRIRERQHDAFGKKDALNKCNKQIETLQKEVRVAKQDVHARESGHFFPLFYSSSPPESVKGFWISIDNIHAELTQKEKRTEVKRTA